MIYQLAQKTLTTVAIGLTLTIVSTSTQAQTLILYDGQEQSVTPDQFNPQSLVFGGFGNQSFDGGVDATNLNTLSGPFGPNSAQAGYSNYNAELSGPGSLTPTTLVNPSFPTLNRQQGYTLSFTAQILSQFNDGINGNDRAGFSVIAISDDRKGIEIGFRSSDIFAQSDSPLFKEDESNEAPIIESLLTNLTTYDLNVLGNSYTLSSGNTNILTGSLRDYTSATGLGTDVYETPNFIFFGDNTTSARADVNFQFASITTNTTTATTTPESSNLLSLFTLMGLGILGMARNVGK